MNSAPMAIGAVALLGGLLLGIVTVFFRYFGPLPPKSPKRIAAGVISLASVPTIILVQVRIEAQLRARSSYRGPDFSLIAMIVESTVGLCLGFYFAYTQRTGK